jgi:hypothetical protein
MPTEKTALWLALGHWSARSPGALGELKAPSLYGAFVFWQLPRDGAMSVADVRALEEEFGWQTRRSQ